MPVLTPPEAPGNPNPPGTVAWAAYNAAYYALRPRQGNALPAGTLRPLQQSAIGIDQPSDETSDVYEFGSAAGDVAATSLTTPTSTPTDLAPFVIPSPTPVWNTMAYGDAGVIPQLGLTTTSILGLARPTNTSRRTLLIVRNLSSSAGSVAVAFDVSASDNTASVVLTPGASVLFDAAVPQNDMNLAAVTATATVVITFIHMPIPK